MEARAVASDGRAAEPEPSRVREDARPYAAGHRSLVAVGDLHGDFHRLMRYLRESDLLLPGTHAWNPDQKRTDLILIGDYVDWRGEPLEDPYGGEGGDPAAGAYEILKLVRTLHRELELLRREDGDFDSRIYALLGNHDDMMLEAHKVFSFMEVQTLEDLLAPPRHYPTIKRRILDMGLTGQQVERVLKFINWFVQGGEVTMAGFGGMAAWKEEMDGELGGFLRRYLRLGAVVNEHLFVHTVPDHPRFWQPLEAIVRLPDPEYLQAKESLLWSRKVWGYDYYTGTRTPPFTEEELDEMLRAMGVKGMVVGHTPMTRGREPLVAYGGRVINIDLHGIPNANALVWVYDPAGQTPSAPLRDGVAS